MQKPYRKHLLVAAFSVLFSMPCHGEQPSAEALFQEALIKETGEHDPDAAVALYRQVILHANNDQVIKAKAELRMGFCEEQLGNTSEALQDYLNVLKHQKSLPSDILQTAQANVERMEPPARKDPQVLVQELTSPDEWTGRQAFAALQMLNDMTKQDMTYKVAANLKNDNPLIREISCQTLAAFGRLAQEAIPDVENLVLDPDPQVRWEALAALQSIGRNQPDVILPFLIAALNDPSVLVRRLVAGGPLGPMALETNKVLRKKVIMALTKALKDPDSDVRLHALDALVSMGKSARSSNNSIRQLNHDPDPEIQTYSADALALVRPVFDPDSYPTIDSQVSGSKSIGAVQNNKNTKGPSYSAPTHSENISPSITANFRVNDQWNVSTGVGGNFSQSQTDVVGPNAGHQSDNRDISYSFGARRTFPSVRFTKSDISQNPNQQTSLSLTFTGTHYFDFNAAHLLPSGPTELQDQDEQENSYGLNAGLNFALSNHLGLGFTLGEGLSFSNTNPTPLTGLNTSNNHWFNFSVSPKYYFLDKTWTPFQAALNPDRCPNLSTTPGLFWSSGHSNAQTLTGTNQFQDNYYRSISLDEQLSIPMTDRITMRLGAGGGYAWSHADVTSTRGGYDGTIPSIHAEVDIRYYFRTLGD